ncbi:phage baseplate assembly protein [Saccharibacter floricola]|uniref:Bacteriophage tail protein n=1 Tax=Saccharibacter floricola DSM 15669 TaxID=1123227 RepID=A0ABQ0P079_9PROT|nr:hypothetical protein [Saccharibacter floricola]GBQ08003.1 bacteriophage tail protein [Saccharibacter floricola DSM 15669]
MSKTDPNALKVTIDNHELTGWQNYSYHAGIDLIPWQLSLSATLHQLDNHDLSFTVGASATVMMGETLMLTGYLVSTSESINANGHTISLIIGSKTQDLTDCSASLVTSDLTLGGNENNGRTLSSMVTQLCAPFGVSVTVDPQIDNPVIPLFAINLTETPYAIIDRLCRQVGLLFTDTAEGNIHLTTVQKAAEKTPSFRYGDTIEEYEEQHSTTNRYSIIKAVLQTSNLLSSEPNSADYVSQVKASESGKQATDPGMTRYRPLLIPVDLGDANFDVAGKRVLWEVARRSGRSQPITITVSGHRDEHGALYTPNTRVTLTKPDDSRVDLVIANVTYEGSANGRRTQLTLLTSASLTPQPIVNKVNQKAGAAAQNDSARH